MLYQVLMTAKPAATREEAGIFTKGRASQGLRYRDPTKPRWFPENK